MSPAPEVAADASYSYLSVTIGGLLHIRLNHERLLGVAAYRESPEEKWRIHFAMRGGHTWTAYDDEDLWKRIVAALSAKLPGGLQPYGDAFVWLDNDASLGFTSWLVKAERRWYIEFTAEGPEHLRVPYLTRAAWEAALRALEDA